MNLENKNLIDLCKEILCIPRLELQKLVWTNSWCKYPSATKNFRGILWRLMLGVIKSETNDLNDWADELNASVVSYNKLKSDLMPRIEDVKFDPLSALGEESESNEWKDYYKNIDLINFIKGDLTRLYMSGIEDEYFQIPRRRDIILTVLFLWASQHKITSYRQGMHEIAGPILYVLETECEAFEQYANESSNDNDKEHPFKGTFSESNLEAYVYWIFEKIMDELEVLYDPTVRNDGQPQVVHFCANLQENLLRQLDPSLCDHLEQNYIQSQLYGMRWSRLLLGREFLCSDTQSLKIWDYIFASCLKTSEVYLKSVIEDKVSQEEILRSKARYSATSPMLLSIGNIMLGMLLHIRAEVIEGDSNTALSLLMHYPSYEDITPILDLADMIRRGVLSPGAHMGVIIDEQIIDAREVASPSPTESSSSKNRSSIFNKSSLNSPPSWLGSSFTSIKNSTTSAIRQASSVASSVASSIIPSTPEKSTSSRSTTKPPPRRFSQDQGVPLTDQSKASFEEIPDNLTDSVESLDISNKIVNNNLDPFGIQEASTISTKPAELKLKSSSRNRISESSEIMTNTTNTNPNSNTTKNYDPNDSLPGEIRSSFLDELIGKKL